MGDTMECKDCEGTGYIGYFPEMDEYGNVVKMVDAICDLCNGLGYCDCAPVEFWKDEQ